uniref:Homeobox domain-containing protein n=3 Tax=Kalanchoe fedtschenkoi TaxID=63787 RepID=A0A7N0ZQS3_KALFE
MDGLSARLAAEEEGIGTSMESFQKSLESQKDLFHSQLVEMQRIVSTQCEFTGVNPLSQEMAAGALSIPIGKKPRDLLNPKAVAYMQSVFSIKDKISKKETREISAKFGITLAQVRDFFACQRTRVREIVQSTQEMSRDRRKVLKELQDGNQENEDSIMLSDLSPVVNTGPVTCDTNMSNAVDPEINGTTLQSDSRPTETDVVTARADSPEFSLATCIPITDEEDIPEPSRTETAPHETAGPTYAEPVPLNVFPPTRSESLVLNSAGISDAGMQPKYIPVEVIPGLDGSEKNFIENIFNLMSTEETFSGKVKLMEGILKVENPSVLNWFLTRGGMMILATWLGQAAVEEQTSVLYVILKVLCHLPLAKASTEQMSVILQSVNSLRFYRTQDISNKARICLARWSKLFAKNQPMRKRDGVKSQVEVAKHKLLTQSINEIIGDESRQSELENTDGNLTSSNKAIENLRKRDRPLQMEMLTASSDESMKRSSMGLPASQGRGRRKVQLVEHPGQKLTGRSQQAARASVSQSRPVSTDDIKKAKLRKEFMEAKYGKKKSEHENLKLGMNQSGAIVSASRVPTQPVPHERRNSRLPLPKTVTEHEPPVVLHPYRTDEKKKDLLPLQSADELKQPLVPLQNSTVEFEPTALHLSGNTDEQPMMPMAKSIAEQMQSMVPILNKYIQTEVSPKNGAKQAQPMVSISSDSAPPQFNSNGTAEQRQPVVPIANSMVQQAPRQKKTIPESKEPFWKQCKRVQVQWKTPPEMVIDKEWRVGSGQNSREVCDQKLRNKREKEFVYQRPEEIPPNPKNPWENEIDYDDSLTPIIPIEPVLDTTDTLQSHNSISLETGNASQMVSVAPTPAPNSLPATISGSAHDPVLLDALLKNPALVFTLTSGQPNSMPSEDTVRLLDMIKANAGALPAANITPNLPSPTPSSNFGTVRDLGLCSMTCKLNNYVYIVSSHDIFTSLVHHSRLFLPVYF